jgi:hypothetical protein
MYTNLFDRAGQWVHMKFAEQYNNPGKGLHDDLEYLSILLNLYYSLRCEAWVCTLASNSCRVVDEMRVTIGGKANRHFADLSKESGVNPPCIEGRSKLTYYNY